MSAVREWGGAGAARPEAHEPEQGGPTTARAVEPGETEHTYVCEYRNTRMGGITWPVVVCLTCREIIDPYDKRMSRSGTHGEFYYSHEHRLTVLEFRQSNKSHNRTFSIHGPSEPWMERIGQGWVMRRTSVDGLATLVDFNLKER